MWYPSPPVIRLARLRRSFLELQPERTMKEHLRVERLLQVAMLATVLALGACAAEPRHGSDEDRAITARVSELLKHYPSLQAPNTVTVQTVKHVLYLRGLVSTPYEKRLAESVVAQTEPSVTVVNQIAVQNNY
jgi:osmotically-inducible protein OsmY